MYSLTLCVKTIDIYINRTFPPEALTIACYRGSVLKAAAEGLCTYVRLFLVQHHTACVHKAGVCRYKQPSLSQTWASAYKTV